MRLVDRSLFITGAFTKQSIYYYFIMWYSPNLSNLHFYWKIFASGMVNTCSVSFRLNFSCRRFIQFWNNVNLNSFCVEQPLETDNKLEFSEWRKQACPLIFSYFERFMANGNSLKDPIIRNVGCSWIGR